MGCKKKCCRKSCCVVCPTGAVGPAGPTGAAPPLTVTGNSGQVNFNTGNINLLGRGGIINTALSAVSMDNADYRNYTPYVVGPQGPSLVGNDPSEYATIQAAINQAVVDGAMNNAKLFVFIKPGTYTEDLTLNAGVELYSDPLQGAIVVGTHTINSIVGDRFVIQNVVFRQALGAQIFNITTSGGGSSNVVFINSQIQQTDPNTTGVIINSPAAADVAQIAMLQTSLVGAGPGAAQPAIMSIGDGQLNMDLFSCGVNRAYIIIASNAVNGIFPYSGNLFRVKSCNLANNHITSDIQNTNAIIQGSTINNNNFTTIPFLSVGAGLYQLIGNSIQNAQIAANNTLDTDTEIWAISNTIFTDSGIVPIELTDDVDLYAQNNIFDVAVGANWLNGLGANSTYFRQGFVINTVGPVSAGTNSFRGGVGSSITGAITITDVTLA
jgi:hypothetical protein